MVFFNVWSITCPADTGAIQYIGQHGTMKISVFSSPVPLRVGTIDLGFYLQRRADNEVIPDADIKIKIIEKDSDQWEANGVATKQQATNKLFYSAIMEISQPGDFVCLVEIDAAEESVTFSFVIRVEESLPRWEQMWPWFVWPFPLIFLYVLIQIRRKRSRPQDNFQ